MDILNDLNPPQREAVSAPPGPVLVLAGPGSGKTRVLTRRIAYLINHLGVSPYNILAVTFTNKAAREMQSRLEKLLSRSVQGMWLGTFHAMCARLLRREQQYLPFSSSFVIFDDDDQQTLIKRAIRELNLDEKLYKPTSLRSAISTAKNNLILPADYPRSSFRDEITAGVYQRYHELLLANNALDFDDLLLYAWKLLDENPSVREEYNRRFEHVLVDEFQDTNLAQYELLRHLAAGRQSIFVVGDEDQSIYRWRGADYRNVLRFEEDYPSCRKILLEQNYRSTQTVLDAAQAVIDRNRHRTPKKLKSLPEHGAGEKIILYEASDDAAEAAYVVEVIRQAVSARRARLGDFAVMYRTNAMSRLLEEAFLRAGMPYRLVGAQRFYGRREIKDLISYLRLAQNPADEVSLARAINVPARGIGEKTYLALQVAARQAGSNPGELLMALAMEGKDSPHWAALGRGAALLADFGALLGKWRKQAETLPLPELFKHIIDDVGYENYINDGTEEGEGRWENVEELRRLTYEYEDRGITAFLENLALVSDQDTIPEEAEAPTLLTLHAAKGLEFPVVIITGLDDGMLPHSRSLDDPEEMAEERRLFYVGITRAKKRLYLVRAAQRSTYGSYQNSIPSRFLDDLPDQLVEGSGNGPRGFSARRNDYSRWEGRTLRGYAGSAEVAKRQSAPVIQQKYRAGMKVNHPAWGEGLVIASRMDGADETVDIVFESVGIKRVDGGLVKMEIIN